MAHREKKYGSHTQNILFSCIRFMVRVICFLWRMSSSKKGYSLSVLNNLLAARFPSYVFSVFFQGAWTKVAEISCDVPEILPES